MPAPSADHARGQKGLDPVRDRCPHGGAMAAKRNRAGAPRKRKAKRLLLTIPEEALTKLLDPAEVFGAVADEHDLEAATEYRADLASAEMAQALVETGRSLSYLHVLREALEGRGYRRGYLDGALAAGRICHALARDLSPRRA